MTSQPAARLTSRVLGTRDELREAGALRYEVFVEEMGIDLVHADHDQGLVIEPQDPESVVIGAFVGGRLAATGRVEIGAVAREHHPWLIDLARDHPRYNEHAVSVSCKLAVHPDHRAGRAASAVMCEMYQVLLRRQVELNLLFCYANAIEFFERLGFERLARPRSLPEFGLVYPLALPVGDVEHMRRKRSIFRRVHAAQSERPNPEGVTA